MKTKDLTTYVAGTILALFAYEILDESGIVEKLKRAVMGR